MCISKKLNFFYASFFYFFLLEIFLQVLISTNRDSFLHFASRSRMRSGNNDKTVPVEGHEKCHDTLWDLTWRWQGSCEGVENSFVWNPRIATFLKKNSFLSLFILIYKCSLSFRHLSTSSIGIIQNIRTTVIIQIYILTNTLYRTWIICKFYIKLLQRFVIVVWKLLDCFLIVGSKDFFYFQDISCYNFIIWFCTRNSLLL